MDEFTPEQIGAALLEEKLYLEELLQTETDGSERQTIQERLTEIDGYFFEQSVMLPKPPPESKTEVKKLEVEIHPAQLLRREIQRVEKRFLALYNGFKSEVKGARCKLKEQCSKCEIEKCVVTLQKWESDIRGQFEGLWELTTPCKDLKRKMESCVSVTCEMVALLKLCSAEAVSTVSDPVAQRESEKCEVQSDLAIMELEQNLEN